MQAPKLRLLVAALKIMERLTMQFRVLLSSMTKAADGSIKALNCPREIMGASGERQFRFALKLTF